MLSYLITNISSVTVKCKFQSGRHTGNGRQYLHSSHVRHPSSDAINSICSQSSGEIERLTG